MQLIPVPMIHWKHPPRGWWARLRRRPVLESELLIDYAQPSYVNRLHISYLSDVFRRDDWYVFEVGLIGGGSACVGALDQHSARIMHNALLNGMDGPLTAGVEFEEPAT